MKKLSFLMIAMSFSIAIIFNSCKKNETTGPVTPDEFNSVESINIIGTQADQIIELNIENAFINDDVIYPEQIANEFLNIENVISATPSFTGSSINVTQKDGVAFNILLIDPTDERLFKEVNKLQEPEIQHEDFVSIKSYPNGTGKAVIIAPFEEDFHTDIEYIQNKLEDAGYTVERYFKQNDLKIFKGNFLKKYDVIIFSTHGSAGAVNRSGVLSTSLSTGVRHTPENFSRLTKEEQEAIGVGGVNGISYYSINVPWLELTTIGNFPNSWIYANSCESSKTDTGPRSLSEAFFNLGAGGYNGYDETIFTKLAGPILKKVVDNFNSGMSLEESSDDARNDNMLQRLAWLIRLSNNPDLYATVDLLDNHQRESEPFYLLESELYFEDFESYNSGSWPENWIADGNGTQISTNHIDNDIKYEGNKSMKIYGAVGGCWGTLAYKPMVDYNTSFTVELAIRNGDENLSGCHPDRAGIGLRKGTSWQNPARGLLQFGGDGIIYGGGGTLLGSFKTNEWYLVRIKYERIPGSQVKLSYWVDGDYLGEEISNSIAEESLLDNFSIVIQEGSAWFDAIKFYSDSN